MPGVSSERFPIIICNKYVTLPNNVNPFQLSVAFYKETNHLICTVNAMTGFYMKCTLGWNGLRHHKKSDQKNNCWKCSLLWQNLKLFIKWVSRVPL